MFAASSVRSENEPNWKSNRMTWACAFTPMLSLGWMAGTAEGAIASRGRGARLGTGDVASGLREGYSSTNVQLHTHNWSEARMYRRKAKVHRDEGDITMAAQNLLSDKVATEPQATYDGVRVNVGTETGRHCRCRDGMGDGAGEPCSRLAGWRGDKMWRSEGEFDVGRHITITKPRAANSSPGPDGVHFLSALPAMLDIPAGEGRVFITSMWF